MRGVIVQGCYRGALLKRQPGAGHQGYRVGGRSAIAAKQRLPGNGDADGAITSSCWVGQCGSASPATSRLRGIPASD